MNHEELCKEKDINLIDHGKTITVKNINGSKLHLNKRDTRLSISFNEIISKKPYPTYSFDI